MVRVKAIDAFERELVAEVKGLKFAASKAKAEAESLKASRDSRIKAKWVISEVLRLAQTNIKAEIEDITTKAIRPVFQRDFSLVLQMEYKRNKFECPIFIEEHGELWVPEDDYGIGLLDLAGFVLRIVLLHLEQPRRINTLVLDEPFKFMGSLSPLAGQMLKEISTRLGLQIIMLTHDKKLAAVGDVEYLVERDNEGSHVSLVRGDVGPKEVEKSKKLKRPAITRFQA